ncbi:MAG: phosphoribosylanthranilate isomerase [Solirubrobacteraceae bacterium]
MTTLPQPSEIPPVAVQPSPQEAPTKVKICGLTNLADAELAVGLGAWALGMIFFADSPRRCSTAQALEIVTAMRRRVELCGVFVNAPLETIVHDSEELGLTMVQLHGDEGPSFCAEVRRRTGARVIKAAQVAGSGDIRDLERFHVDFHLLDARSRAVARQGMRGGTGETFDWGLLRARRSNVPLILSGGLTGENVAEAISVTRPFAVDSASGTESAPGHKDPGKLRALFYAVRGTVEHDPAQPGEEAGEGPHRDAPGVPAPIAEPA